MPFFLILNTIILIVHWEMKNKASCVEMNFVVGR